MIDVMRQTEVANAAAKTDDFWPAQPEFIAAFPWEGLYYNSPNPGSK